MLETPFCFFYLPKPRSNSCIWILIEVDFHYLCVHFQNIGNFAAGHAHDVNVTSRCRQCDVECHIRGMFVLFGMYGKRRHIYIPWYPMITSPVLLWTCVEFPIKSQMKWQHRCGEPKAKLMNVNCFTHIRKAMIL